MRTIGVDFGHCESAATCLNSSHNAVERLAVSAETKAPVIPSAIYLTKEQIERLSALKTLDDLVHVKEIGPYKIGERAQVACKNCRENEGEFFQYFKCPMDDTNESCGSLLLAELTHQQVIAAFLYQFIDDIININTTSFAGESKETLSLIVGCPSSKKWVEDSPRKYYETLILNSTGVKSVKVIEESLASMYSGLEQSNEKVRYSAAEGVMVFDFGSSTADCTYMQQGLRRFDFSWDLGASKIENLILSEIEKEYEDKNAGAVPYAPNMKEAAEIYVRKWKETYSKDGLEGKIHIDFNDDDDFSSKWTGERVMQLLEHHEFIPDGVLQLSGSWYNLCERFMQEAKRRLIGKPLARMDGFISPCKTIILTGGASQMGFIKEIASRVFPDTTIVHNQKVCSFTVSDGLAWYSLIDANYDGCKERITAEAERYTFDSLKAEILKDAIPAVKKHILVSAEEWSENPQDASLQDLQNIVTNALSEKNLPTDKKELQNSLNHAADRWNTDFINSVREQANKEAQWLFSEGISEGLNLNKDILAVLQQQVPQLDSSTLVQSFDMRATSVKVLSGLTSLIVGGVIVALFTEVPILRFFIGGGWAQLAQDILNALTSPDSTKLRSQKTRKNDYVKIKKQIEKKDFVSKMQEVIDNAFELQKQQFEQTKADTITRVLDIVTLKYFELTE